MFFREIGGSKVSAERVTSDKHNESRWKQFVAAQAPKVSTIKSYTPSV